MGGASVTGKVATERAAHKPSPTDQILLEQPGELARPALGRSGGCEDFVIDEILEVQPLFL